MTELEKKKLSVELLRVNAAKEELILRIMERMEEIDRIRDMIVVQEAKEVEIKQKLGLS